jgi:hypothetical protein
MSEMKPTRQAPRRRPTSGYALLREHAGGNDWVMRRLGIWGSTTILEDPRIGARFTASPDAMPELLALARHNFPRDDIVPIPFSAMYYDVLSGADAAQSVLSYAHPRGRNL